MLGTNGTSGYTRVNQNAYDELVSDPDIGPRPA